MPIYLYFCDLMKSLVKLYKHNIYSVMGTLVFHIILVGFFLPAEMNIRVSFREVPVLVEIPFEMMEEEIVEQPEEKSEIQSTNDPSAMINQSASMTNRPSNRTSRGGERFFDENYQQDIEAAQKLASDVSNQLSKKIVDINSIEMPEDNTEGKKKDEISNLVYSGESNIEYHLENRYHLRLPIPVYLAKGGGVVTVDIAVNREGRVVSAKPRNTSSVRDDQVYLYARAAAERTLFNRDPSAPEIQNGTIRYTLVAQ